MEKDRVIYRSVQEPLNEDGTQHLFASDVQIGEEGRYYLFYCLHRSPTVSVTVCDEPAGEYQFYGHIRYVDGILYGQKQGDVFNFDPGVLKDDDGRIYLYTRLSYLKDAPMRKYLAGMFQIDGSYCVELDKDILTLKSDPVLAVPGKVLSEGTDFEGHRFLRQAACGILMGGII